MYKNWTQFFQKQLEKIKKNLEKLNDFYFQTNSFNFQLKQLGIIMNQDDKFIHQQLYEEQQQTNQQEDHLINPILAPEFLDDPNKEFGFYSAQLNKKKDKNSRKNSQNAPNSYSNLSNSASQSKNKSQSKIEINKNENLKNKQQNSFSKIPDSFTDNEKNLKNSPLKCQKGVFLRSKSNFERYQYLKELNQKLDEDFKKQVKNDHQQYFENNNYSENLSPNNNNQKLNFKIEKRNSIISLQNIECNSNLDVTFQELKNPQQNQQQKQEKTKSTFSSKSLQKSQNQIQNSQNQNKNQTQTQSQIQSLNQSQTQTQIQNQNLNLNLNNIDKTQENNLDTQSEKINILENLVKNRLTLVKSQSSNKKAIQDLHFYNSKQIFKRFQNKKKQQTKKSPPKKTEFQKLKEQQKNDKNLLQQQIQHNHSQNLEISQKFHQNYQKNNNANTSANFSNFTIQNILKSLKNFQNERKEFVRKISQQKTTITQKSLSPRKNTKIFQKNNNHSNQLLDLSFIQKFQPQNFSQNNSPTSLNFSPIKIRPETIDAQKSKPQLCQKFYIKQKQIVFFSLHLKLQQQYQQQIS
ncbi:hypothetical protein PPERSA_09710 [Pseudocohnilembus persalinus]|uniref:Uncharacterized protein n=1 Tax=Pseudocohnilembus persalinus TaxID=266149 RepID=A0A0V0QUZ0_PSEPJ|nr:hypothetical protein PPERSA_09710 [Pseudocohnilembus persalinus]|eukprot:KRX06098.1 hypothetical protein PPERSA_09710 [Pseudocohnilembus persalinus]